MSKTSSLPCSVCWEPESQMADLEAESQHRPSGAESCLGTWLLLSLTFFLSAVAPSLLSAILPQATTSPESMEQSCSVFQAPLAKSSDHSDLPQRR